MSAILIILAVLAADAEAEVAAPRGFHEIRRDLDELLRQEASAKDHVGRSEAVHAIAALYGEIVRDPRLTASPTLQQYKARLWRRLVDVKEEIETKQAQRERARERSVPREELERVRQAEVDAMSASQALADQLSLVGYSLGGPAQVFASSGGAFGGGPIDDGDELVRLIEHTISPAFWETNGGPGSIFYYAPLHALVVRATDDVHGRVGGLVDGLRAAP